jgi:hypothetical protein
MYKIIGLIAILCMSGCKSNCDPVTYGVTSATVTAVIQAKKLGKSAIILSPDKHLGGLAGGVRALPIREIRAASAACPVSSTIVCISNIKKMIPGGGNLKTNMAIMDKAPKPCSKTIKRCGFFDLNTLSAANNIA